MRWQTKSRNNFARQMALLAVLTWSIGGAMGAGPEQNLIQEATELLHPKTGPAIEDDELERRLAAYQKQPTIANRDSLNGWLNARQNLSKPADLSAASTAGTVKSIKSNPLFRDAGDAQDSNWIQTIFNRLGRPKMPRLNAPEGNLSGFSLPSFITPLMWTLLAGLVAFFAYQVAMHVQIKQRIRRKSGGLLEDNEPVRSQSEWLTLADQHEAAGEYRLAVRCLYIAMLLSFDEYRVARFDRRQTNWEHLARIEASPLYSAEIGFRELTQRFDRIWYGHQSIGLGDVAEFRAAFSNINARGPGMPT
jgi:hypothetical protein